MSKSFKTFSFLLTALLTIFIGRASAFGDSITFYEDEYYSGHSFRVEGSGEISNLRTKDLGALDNFNDVISSISISGNFSLTLYADINFGGQSVTINLSRPYLTTLSFSDWNDRISSIKWNPLFPNTDESKAVFYDQPNFQGNSFVIKGIGNVYKLADKRRGSRHADWNDQIRSLKVYGPNTLVVLYKDSKYRGATLSVTSDAATLRGFSGAASSVKVFD